MMSVKPLPVNYSSILGTFREAAPMHFLFKIESLSQFSNNSVVRYVSNEFEAEGYKWKLSLYPEGNKNENGKDHISLYLMLVDTSSGSTSLHDCWELNVLFRLFLFDQIRGRYLIRGDAEGRTRKFNEMKKVWGFPRFQPLAIFKDPANGYLVDDTCVFGAEVFIAKPTGNIECVSMVKQATTVSHTWRIYNFSKIKEECLYSEKFKAGDHDWRVKLYPKGVSAGKDNSVSIFLELADDKENPSLKVFANYKLRVMDRENYKKHIEISSDDWLCATSSNRWGCQKFVGLDLLKKGYLFNEACVVEAEVKVLGVVASKRQKLS